ncbi:MAG: trimethylamine methyltransferase family protein [Pseudomonadota bacterium]
MSPRRGRRRAPPAKREVNYRQLRNPFPPLRVYSDDHIAALHNAALDVLERYGIQVNLQEARTAFRIAGATVRDNMVFIGRDMVAAALATAPASFPLIAGAPERNLIMEPGAMIFQPGAGCPHATDLERGRRPGTERDYRELISLTQHFDVLHMIPPLVEPQDVPMHLRHYAMLQGQMELTDKLPFIFARGTGQVAESFEMLRDFRCLSDAEFTTNAHCYTIINTNSPRQIDVPMARGIMDFARAGQVSIITPFTLMGAMAPITVAGAMTLSHAEALAAITLGQLTRPGAPMCYGTFTSNVDMKSGAPVFGTPEHFRASLVAGQLARHIGLPWRCASGASGAANDVQAAHETQFGTWGCLMAGATVTIHAAGWLEGGLTVSYEKLITDVEVLQMLAELCTSASEHTDEIALDAIEEVSPGSHFFAAAHTMTRYQTEFYEPLNADYSNFGTWQDRGSIDATSRATERWKQILCDFTPPAVNPDNLAALTRYIAQKTEAGGCAVEGG